MIYLIITTSINNRYGTKDENERKERYLYAINETLKNIPSEITPIIVENNGKRKTYLDSICRDIVYTDNNKYQFKSKGVNELLDIKEVIQIYNIQDNDIIIKLTGRYRVLSATFFKDIIENKYDAFVKFYNVDSLKFEKYNCVLGFYAIRANYLKLYNHLSIDNYKSAEVAFARYFKICGAHLKEVEHLDIECCFSENLRKLIV